MRVVRDNVCGMADLSGEGYDLWNVGCLNIFRENSDKAVATFLLWEKVSQDLKQKRKNKKTTKDTLTYAHTYS